MFLRTPSEPGEGDSRIARALTVRYVFALLLVASLSTAAWFSLRLVIADQESTAAIVNVSGRQRMLSQRTALLSHLLVNSAPAARGDVRAALQKSIDLFELSHKGLTQGSTEMGLPSTMSETVRAAYFGGAQPLDAQVQAYVRAVRDLLQKDDAQFLPGDAHLQFITQTALTPLVTALNAMVEQYQKEGEASVRKLESAETAFWGLTLLLLALEAALIFQPFIRHTHAAMNRLQQLTRELQVHRDSLEATVRQRTDELERRSHQLAESEEKFRLISTTASDAIVIVNEQMHVQYWNPAAEAVFGMPGIEAMGRSLDAVLTSPDVMQALRQRLASAMRHEPPPATGQNLEVSALHRDGSQFTVELSLSPFELRGQWQIVVIVRDISARKRAEADLRIAATAFEAQEGILVTDPALRILRVNKSFTRITGYVADDVLGQKPSVLGSGRHDDHYYEAMWESLKTTGAWEGEIWNRRKNGEVYPELLSIAAVKDAAGEVVNYVGTFSDITVSKAAADEIENLAFYDPLTLLPNRRLLLDRLKQALAFSARSGSSGALLFIDLDNFKMLNDTMGHDMGDMLLQQVGERLVACVRKRDTVARIGGDEFVVVLEELSPGAMDAAAQAESIAGKILESLTRPYALGSNEHRNTPSIGVTIFQGEHGEMEELLKQADIAMYQAKNSGRNAVRFFDPAMQVGLNARVQMEAELRDALARDQLVLYYQAQISQHGQVLGAEVLIRWQHPDKGMVSPAMFIPLAEDTGLVLTIGQWVLDTACAQLSHWAADPRMAGLTLAVNVSARQFRQHDFVEQVRATLQRHGTPPGRLKLELTESMLLHDIEGTIAKMQALKEQGVQFSLDDFGTGYSSLQYLKQLPLDQLKIDQSFVHDITTDNSDKAIVTAIIDMARHLELSVIAEGVETEAQRSLLQASGCLHYQGFLFGRPVPLQGFEASVREGSPQPGAALLH